MNRTKKKITYTNVIGMKASSRNMMLNQKKNFCVVEKYASICL